MKTAEKKASAIKKRASELLYSIKYTASVLDALERIEEALSNEQKITRHACAESMLTIEPGNTDAMYTAIMNTKAV